MASVALASSFADAQASAARPVSGASVLAPVPPFQLANLAAAPSGITEAEILRRWLASNREIAALRATVGASRFDVLTASLWPNPTLSVNALGTPVGTPPDGRINVGAQVGFTLPVFGQIAARVDAAQASLAVAEVAVKAALWTRAADLQDAMVERAYADAHVQTAERNLQEMTRVLDIITRRAAAGINAEYDQLRVQLATATLRAARDNAVIERNRSESRLVALVGEPQRAPLPIALSGLAGFRGPETLDALVSMALRSRPDLELARRGVHLAEASARRWERDAVPAPDVWLGGYVTVADTSFSVLGGVQVALPAFDRNQGQVGRARAEASSAREATLGAERRIREEVRGAWEARAAARSALEQFRANVLAVAEGLVRRAETTYQLGAGGAFSIVDLLDAYRTLWDAREQELALQFALADAEADLERAIAVVTPV